MSRAPTSRLSTLLPAVALAAAGASLVAYAVILAWSSGRLGTAARPSHATLGLLVVGRMAAGTVFVMAMLLAAGGLFGRRVVLGILALGLGCRLLLLPATPPVDAHHQRYLWEGGLVAHGHNPYRSSPAEAQAARADRLVTRDPRRGALGELALAAGRAPERSPHPQLTAYHLPLAQAAFAAAHVITPWRPLGWRLLTLAADAATALLVLGLLGALGRPRWWVALYAWNPLVLHEVAAAAHMDVLALPAALLGLWLALRQRPVAATVALCAGTLTALWPALLLPVVLRGQLKDSRALLGITGVLAFTAVALAGTVALGLGADAPSGLAAAASRLRENDALFAPLALGGRHLAALLGHGATFGGVLARLGAASLYAALLVLLLRRPLSGPQDLAGRALLALAALLALSPVPLPWHFLWIAPFVALRPRASLLLWSALLPLHQLTYRWPWLAFAQHLPVLALLGAELYTARYTASPMDPFHGDLYAERLS